MGKFKKDKTSEPKTGHLVDSASHGECPFAGSAYTGEYQLDAGYHGFALGNSCFSLFVSKSAESNGAPGWWDRDSEKPYMTHQYAEFADKIFKDQKFLQLFPS